MAIRAPDGANKAGHNVRIDNFSLIFFSGFINCVN